MDYREVARYLIERPGIPLRRISAQYGFADSWASNTRNKANPHIETVVKLAALNNLQLALVDKDGAIVETIEAPDHQDQSITST